jgi:hypothetical protein
MSKMRQSHLRAKSTLEHLALTPGKSEVLLTPYQWSPVLWYPSRCHLPCTYLVRSFASLTRWSTTGSVALNLGKTVDDTSCNSACDSSSRRKLHPNGSYCRCHHRDHPRDYWCDCRVIGTHVGGPIREQRSKIIFG